MRIYFLTKLVIFYGGTVGIESVQGSRFMINDADVYDLGGRRVKTPAQNGIYVTKGQEVVIN